MQVETAKFTPFIDIICSCYLQQFRRQSAFWYFSTISHQTRHILNLSTHIHKVYDMDNSRQWMCCQPSCHNLDNLRLSLLKAHFIHAAIQTIFFTISLLMSLSLQCITTDNRFVFCHLYHLVRFFSYVPFKYCVIIDRFFLFHFKNHIQVMEFVFCGKKNETLFKWTMCVHLVGY